MRRLFVWMRVMALACFLIVTSRKSAIAQAAAMPPVVVQGLDSLLAGRDSAAVEVWGRAWTGTDTTQAATLLASLSTAAEILGRPRGYDLVKLFEVGPNLRQVYVVIRYDKQPLYARFLAYRPQREWQVNSVLWNTDPELVFPLSLLTPP